MRLLDLFCGAGMAADGYRMAGFEYILGIDIKPQPHYPYEFQRMDALDVLRSIDLSYFDAIHASPPCQAFTRSRHLRDAQGGKSSAVDLLTPVLAELASVDIPWVVENVPGAPAMRNAVVECGSAYELGVRRHRLFVSNRPITGSVCQHKKQGRPWGVYHVMGDSIPSGGRTVTSLQQGLEVMGVQRQIPWSSLKEGFPPKYTEHIGKQLASWCGVLA